MMMKDIKRNRRLVENCSGIENIERSTTKVWKKRLEMQEENKIGLQKWKESMKHIRGNKGKKIVSLEVVRERERERERLTDQPTI